MNFFDETSYKKVLHKRLLDKKKQLRSITFEKLAAAARVQKTYLSRVIHGEAQLSEDQLFRACEFLGFTPDEQDYMLLLLQHERSEVPQRRAVLLKKMAGIRDRYRRTGANISATAAPLEPSQIAAYFTDPHMQLVHVMLCIPKYATNLPGICASLGLSEGRLSKILNFLLQSGIIRRDDTGYVVLRDAIHLDSQALVYESYKKLMRLKALEHADSHSDSERFEFSVIFSGDETNRQVIRGDLMNLIKRTEKLVSASPQEEVYQMQIDLFRWS